MKRAITFAIMFLLIAPFALAQDNKTAAAQKGAENWLAITDKADYAGSYDRASAMFKAAVTKDDWVQKIRAARGPLGKVESRKLQSAQYTKSLPGAPDGEYVVMQYETSFENKKAAVETIVPMLDKDGQWRVSGYFIK